MIAILSTTQGRGYGAEVVLCQLLGAWREPALSLVVVAPPSSAAATAAADAGIARIPLRTSRDAALANLAAGHRACRDLRGCRLVHTWSARGLEVSWWIGRRLHVPATATLHDHPDAPVQTPLRRRLWRLTANLQDAVAFPGSALESAWRAAGFRRPSRVIPNGSGGLPPRQRADSEDLVIGFLGMYAAWKGFAIAGSWARGEWPSHVRWAFFGEPHRTLIGPAASLAVQLPGRVRLHGQTPRESIFGAVDILVHCSTAFDPFPTVLIEAAQAGIPAVASALGGAGEIVEHGTTGFLFDPAAPDLGLAYLRQLVADAGLRTRLGAAARQRYERCFSPQRMVEGYAGFWKAALERARSW